MSTVNCPSGETSVDNGLITGMPSGVSLYFKIISSQLASGCLNFTGIGVMNAGDSILITPSVNQFEWSTLCGGGYASFAILAVGTPAMANDSFFCLSQWHTSVAVLVDGCSLYEMMDNYAVPIHPACSVDSAVMTFSNAISPGDFSVFPNPFSSETTIKPGGNFSNATLIVSNVFGQQVKEAEHVSGTSFIVQRDGLPEGVYFLRIVENNKVAGMKRLVITD